MTAGLRGRRILVTRPAAQAATLAELIAAQGGEAICFPLLEISPADDLVPLQAAAVRLADYAIAIFISPNAVDYGLPVLLSGRVWPVGVRAAAIGQSTVKVLAAHGVSGTIAPSVRFDSEALLDLPEFQTAAVAGRRVLILRGNGGRELLTDSLKARGASVDCVTCYRRSAPLDASVLVARLHDGTVDALTISSSEGLRNLWALLGPLERQLLAQLPLFVPHARIGEEAAGLGLTKVVLTGPADAGILAGLLAFEGFPAK